MRQYKQTIEDWEVFIAELMLPQNPASLCIEAKGRHAGLYPIVHVPSSNPWGLRPGQHHVATIVLALAGDDMVGRVARHDCDNAKCINLAHLRSGTRADNLEDQRLRNRFARGDQHGSHTHSERWHRGDMHWSRRLPERRPTGDRSGARKHPELYRGSSNARAKLTTDIVRQIHRSVLDGASYNSVGIKFGILRTSVGNIVHGRTWGDVYEEFQQEWEQRRKVAPRQPRSDIGSVHSIGEIDAL